MEPAVAGRLGGAVARWARLRSAAAVAVALALALAACGPSGEADGPRGADAGAADGTRAPAGGAGNPDAAAADRAAPDPARIVDELRPRVRIAGRPDPSFSLAERMERHRVPGVSLAVIDDHRIVWARGFGTREVGSGQPVDTATLFLAGSISKPVFATGALRLVETGQLTLDADVNRSLESWKVPETRHTRDRPVTLRHLLSHTGGLTVHGFPGYDVDAQLPTVPEILDGAPPANTEPVRSDTVPGARFTYSGGGYTVAQLVATDVTGEPFPDLMRRLVLEPAGMVHSTFRNPPPASRARRAAAGHERWDTPVEGRYHVYPEMAAAGLWTTATDLARWAIAVSRAYRGEDGLLSPETAREMLSRQVQVGEDAGVGEAAWGLGPALAGRGDSLSFRHGGRDEGFVATLSMWPATGRGLVVLTNGTSGALLGEIRRAFASLYGLPGPERIEKRLAPADSVTLAGLAGRYEGTGRVSGLTAEVRREGDALWVEAPGLVRGRLFPEGRDVFFDRSTGTAWRFVRPGGEPEGAATRLEVLPHGGDRPWVAERATEGGGGEG